jgi:hypothetical protein
MHHVFLTCETVHIGIPQSAYRRCEQFMGGISAVIRQPEPKSSRPRLAGHCAHLAGPTLGSARAVGRRYPLSGLVVGNRLGRIHGRNDIIGGRAQGSPAILGPGPDRQPPKTLPSENVRETGCQAATSRRGDQQRVNPPRAAMEPASTRASPLRRLTRPAGGGERNFEPALRSSGR